MGLRRTATAAAITVLMASAVPASSEETVRLGITGPSEAPSAADVLGELLAGFAPPPRLAVETVAGPEAVRGLKPALRRGDVDAAELPLGALARESALFAADQIPRLAATAGARRDLHDRLDRILSRRLTEDGLVLVALLPGAPLGILSRRRFEAPADLRGARVWAPTAATRRIAELLGEAAGGDVRPVVAPAEADVLLVSAGAALRVPAFATTDGPRRAEGWTFQSVPDWQPMRAIVVTERMLGRLGGGSGARIDNWRSTRSERWRAAASERAGRSERELEEAGAALATASPAMVEAFTEIGRRMSAEWLPGAGADGASLLGGRGEE